MYVRHWIFLNAGGTKYASAKLKIQLAAVARPTPLARYCRGKISDMKTHAPGAYLTSFLVKNHSMPPLEALEHGLKIHTHVKP